MFSQARIRTIVNSFISASSTSYQTQLAKAARGSGERGNLSANAQEATRKHSLRSSLRAGTPTESDTVPARSPAVM
jgi:hypothetical protein